MSIGSTIRRHRRESLMTQKDLTEAVRRRAGTATAVETISRWEREKNEPSPRAKQALVDIFEGLRAEDLFSGERR